MEEIEERDYFDKVINEVTIGEEIKIPGGLEEKLGQWKWGSYGWVSPASLIMSAALHKHLYPETDCCRIWAKDENDRPIPRSYSIRTFDEHVTIPMLAKHDLCKNYCSPNSGMQGTRAIEKMRGSVRLDRTFDSKQRTRFDLKLFASILNDIDDLSSDEALVVLRYLVQHAKEIKISRIAADERVKSVSNGSFDPWRFLTKTSDPELTKCYVAACLNAIYSPSGLEVAGVAAHRTAADARAGKPGDITLVRDNVNVAAIEVKDKSQHIDWSNIDRAINIIQRHRDITYFAFVLESTEATVTKTVRELLISDRLQTELGSKIIVLSLRGLYLQAISLVGSKSLAGTIGNYISETPDVKPETKTKWIKATSK